MGLLVKRFIQFIWFNNPVQQGGPTQGGSTAGGLTVTAGGVVVSAGGVTVTGNSTITGTLGGVTTLTASGVVTGSALVPSGSTVATNGVYLPAANTLGLATNSGLRFQISAAGALGIGGATYGTAGEVLTSGGASAAPTWAAAAVGYNPSGTTTPLIYYVRLPINSAASNVAVQAGFGATSGGSATVTFPTAFTSAPIVTVSRGGTAAAAEFACITTASTTSVTVRTYNSGGSDVSADFHWIAVGPVA